MKRLIAVLLMTLPAWGQTAATSATTPSDPWKSLNFLEGTWGASTDEKSGVSSSGTYTFRRELGGHVIARRSTAEAGCKGTATFDCEHGDVLYVYRDAPMPGMKAIYFDNEGHVIHYDVSTPSATKVVFLSEQGRPGPQFRLTYELKDGLMWGKFQTQMPGQTDWKSYLEWSGPKK